MGLVRPGFLRGRSGGFRRSQIHSTGVDQNETHHDAREQGDIKNDGAHRRDHTDSNGSILFF